MEQNFLMRKYLHRLAQNVACGWGQVDKFTPAQNIAVMFCADSAPPPPHPSCDIHIP
jgi:hypothetical protein